MKIEIKRKWKFLFVLVLVMAFGMSMEFLQTIHNWLGGGIAFLLGFGSDKIFEWVAK